MDRTESCGLWAGLGYHHGYHHSYHAEGDSFLMERCVFLLSASSGVAVCCGDRASHWLEGSDNSQQLLLGPVWPLSCVLISGGASCGLYLVSKPEVLKNFFQASHSLLLRLLWAQGLHE